MEYITPREIHKLGIRHIPEDRQKSGVIANFTVSENKILNRIQIPNLPNNPTDNDIYKYYKITKKEQNLINTMIEDSKNKKTKKKKRY